MFSQIKDTKHIRQDFSFCGLGRAPGVGLWGTGGCPGGQKFIFSYMVMWHIKSEGDEEQTGDLWVRSNGQISLNFGYKVNFKDFDTKLCVCVLTNKKIENILNRIFILLPGSYPSDGTLGCWRGGGGGQKLQCGDLRWLPIDCT